MMLVLCSSRSRFFLTAFLSLSLLSILAFDSRGSLDRLDHVVSDLGSVVSLFKSPESSDDDLDQQLIASSVPLNFSFKGLINKRQEFLLIYSVFSLYPARAPPFLAG
jgi:hypothetical protein